MPSSIAPRPRRLRPLAACLLGLPLLAACQSQPPSNVGSSGYRLDPSSDSPAELGAQAPRSQDLVQATERMARDIAARTDINDPDSPPRIVVGPVRNESTMRSREYQVFLVRLRGLLNSSGARHGLEFMQSRAFVEEARAREFGFDQEGSAPDDYRSEADYELTLEIYDLPSGGTNYFLFNYQLVQLRDADSGPDRGAGRIVWENQYEVKFQ